MTWAGCLQSRGDAGAGSPWAATRGSGPGREAPAPMGLQAAGGSGAGGSGGAGMMWDPKIIGDGNLQSGAALSELSVRNGLQSVRASSSNGQTGRGLKFSCTVNKTKQQCFTAEEISPYLT